MESIFRNKFLKILLILITIDIVLIGGWVLYIKPDTSVTIILLFAVPFVFLANLAMSAILFFIKRAYAKFLLLNALVSPVILCALFIGYIKIMLYKNFEKWELKIDEVNYSISYWSESEHVEIKDIYSVNIVKHDKHSTSSSGYDRGTVSVKNDTVYFYSIDSSQYYIYKNHIYNFKQIEKLPVIKKY